LKKALFSERLLKKLTLFRKRALSVFRSPALSGQAKTYSPGGLTAASKNFAKNRSKNTKKAARRLACF
jgi:hypothetical protein